MSEIPQIKRKAHEYFKKGDWVSAIAEYEKLIERGEADPNLHNTVGDLYLKLGQPPRAIGCFCNAVDAYVSEGLFHNAIAVCKKTIRVDPTHTETYRRLGDLYAGHGFPNEAVRYYCEFVDRSLEGGKCEESLEVCSLITSLRSRSPEIREKIAEIYERLERMDLARQELIEAAGLLRERGLDEKAQELETRASEASGEPMVTQPEGASVLDMPPGAAGGPNGGMVQDGTQWTWGEGEPGEQQHSAAQGGQTEPIIAQTSGQRAGAQAVEVQRTEAAPAAIQTEDADGASSSKAPGMFQSEEELFQAVGSLKESTQEILAGDAQGHYDMAVSYLEMGLFDEAQDELKEAAKDKSLAIPCMELSGKCLLAKGSCTEAIELLQQAIRRAGGDLQATIGLHFGLGEAYEAVGNFEMAAEEFRVVCAVDGSFEGVRARLAQVASLLDGTLH